MEIFKYLKFINEASLRGNIGIPGEGSNRSSKNIQSWISSITKELDREELLWMANEVKDGRIKEDEFQRRLKKIDPQVSWLDKVNKEQAEKVAEFERTNMGLLRNFGNFIGTAKRLQSGKEKELSKLCEDSFKNLFGTLLETVVLDFKIDESGARELMSKTPKKPKEEKSKKKETEIEIEITQKTAEQIVDERVKDEVMKRKILRTIQQGKGLNSKAMLNLPMFKEGVEKILGNKSTEYIECLNNIVKVMSFFDATLSEDQITQALANSASGACDIQIKEKPKSEENEEEIEDEAEKLLKDLEEGKDLTKTDSKVLTEIEVKIVARGVDLGVLIHESLKAVYKLATQMSLEHLPVEVAKQVLSQTDTVSDEPQEFKYGPSMQKQFEKVINEHPRVKEIVEYYISLSSSGDVNVSRQSENDLAGFQEQLFFYVFGFLAAMGKDDPKEMLKVVYAVLDDKKADYEKLFFPIVANSAASLEQLFKWKKQQTKKSETKPEKSEVPTKPKSEENFDNKLARLQEELDDATDKEDYEKAAKLRDQIAELKKKNK